MMTGAMGGTPSLGTLIVVLVIVAVLVRRNMRARALKVERLWIRPVLFAIIVSATLGATALPLDPLSLAVFALAVVAGVGLGWQRGRFMKITVNPDTHDLTSQASPLGILFILAVLAVRLVLRGVLTESHAVLGLTAAAVTDGLILLVGAMMVTQSLEMWLRAQRLLDEARAAKAARDAAGGQPPLVS